MLYFANISNLVVYGAFQLEVQQPGQMSTVSHTVENTEMGPNNINSLEAAGEHEDIWSFIQFRCLLVTALVYAGNVTRYVAQHTVSNLAPRCVTPEILATDLPLCFF